LKNNFNEEQKRVCQTIGWCDCNQGNLKKEEKDKVKARQKRPGNFGSVSLDMGGRVVKAQEQAITFPKKNFT